MSWDADDDSFYAQIDVEAAVQQAQAKRQQQQQQQQYQQHSHAAAGPPSAMALPQQQQQTRMGGPPAGSGLRSLFTSSAQRSGSCAVPIAAQTGVSWQGEPRGQLQGGTGPQGGPQAQGHGGGQWQQQPHAVGAQPGQGQPPQQQQQQRPYGYPQQQQQQRPYACPQQGHLQPPHGSHGSEASMGPHRPVQPGGPASGTARPNQPPVPVQPSPQQQYGQQQQQPPHYQHHQPSHYGQHHQPHQPGQQLQQQQQQPFGQHPQQPYGGPHQQQQAQPPHGHHQQPQHVQQQQQQQLLMDGASSSMAVAPGGGQAVSRSGHAPPASSSGQATGPLLYVNLELGKDQMIEVKCGYREAVVEALKRIPGGQWDTRNRLWKFPLTQNERIVEVLQGLKSVRISLEPLPQIVSEVLKAAASCPDDSERYCHIPTNLEQQLMPFQREGIKFALRHGGRCLIGDEMGLGKTVQAIAVASAYRDEWPVLVIAPSSLRESWADALHRWLGITADHMHIVHSGKDAANVPSNIQFLIVSYNFVQKMDLNKRFGVVICDESHFLKEGTAQRTKATVPLVKEVRRAILLSGTPALNKPKEIFQQLAALVPRAKLKMAQFGDRYCQGNYFDKYGGASNLGELNAMLKNSVMIRRLKNEVLTQLPRKRRQQVMLDLDESAKKQLAGLQRQLEVVRQVMGEEARKNVASGNAAGPGSARVEQNTVITELYNKTAEVKVKAVQDYVTLLLDNNQKFLVFGHHTTMLDAIEHTCNRYKPAEKGKHLKFIRIDGSTPSNRRQALVNDFQENEDYRVAILSIRAAGTGLTLTAASTVVFAEMTWVPGETIQAEDRAHRIGQASSVNVYFLHARGSIDDLIWQSIQNKLDNVGEAIDGQAAALDARRVEAPDRGQMTLAPFMTQSKPDEVPLPLQQQPHQQGPGAGGRAGAGAANGSTSSKSPSKGQQTSLLNFFPSNKRDQQKEKQQAAPPSGARHEQQQAPAHHGGYAQQQPAYQQQQPAYQQQQPAYQQQQQQPGTARPQDWQQAAPPGATMPLHAPSGRANVDRASGPPQVGVKRPFDGS